MLSDAALRNLKPKSKIYISLAMARELLLDARKTILKGISPAFESNA